MIVMQCRASRKYAGSIGHGADVYEALLQVCRNHKVRTAEIRGIGYMSTVLLAVYNAEDNAYVQPDEPTAGGQVLSLIGNVSRKGDKVSLHLMAQVLVADGDGHRVVGGRLMGGAVTDLEFFIDAVDDFGFVRDEDEDGLAPWVQIESEAHIANEAQSHRSEFLPGRLGSRPDESEEEYELREGDRLQHPKLGPCVVTQVPDEDRASIRLEGGRVVELHMGLLKLVRTKLDRDGRQHFKVQVRRRT